MQARMPFFGWVASFIVGCVLGAGLTAAGAPWSTISPRQMRPQDVLEIYIPGTPQNDLNFFAVDVETRLVVRVAGAGGRLWFKTEEGPDFQLHRRHIPASQWVRKWRYGRYPMVVKSNTFMLENWWVGVPVTIRDDDGHLLHGIVVGARLRRPPLEPLVPTPEDDPGT